LHSELHLRITNVDELVAVISDCAKGKPQAQEKLYKLFSRKLLGVCMRYAKNRDEAEDMLHDGFIKIFGNIHQFGFQGSFEGWMRRIMVNTALEKFRKVKPVSRIDDVVETADDVSFDVTAGAIDAQELLNLIQALSPQYRLVFNLYAIEGYTHKEIAEMLNISEGTSKSNLARARAILQQRVKILYGETFAEAV
jgi:RNA polymerase sigma factor (sigma-70 family)